ISFLTSTFSTPSEKLLKDTPSILATTKDFPKNVKWIVEASLSLKTRFLLESGMPIAVISSTSFRIHKNIVSFADFFEALLCFFVAGIFVWMELYREFSVRALDLISIRVFGNSENFVISPFSPHEPSMPLEVTTVDGRKSRSPNL